MTAAAVTKAAGAGSSDAEAGAGLLAADPTVEENQQVDALGDSAYGTGDMLKALAAAGHRAWSNQTAGRGDRGRIHDR